MKAKELSFKELQRSYKSSGRYSKDSPESIKRMMLSLGEANQTHGRYVLKSQQYTSLQMVGFINTSPGGMLCLVLNTNVNLQTKKLHY